jgi:hypothetical protein
VPVIWVAHREEVAQCGCGPIREGRDRLAKVPAKEVY